MQFVKPLKLFILFFLIYSGIANGSNQIDVTPFYIKNYTNNFTNKYKFSYDIELTENGVTGSGKMLARVSNGKDVKKFKQDWIGVLNTADIILGNEKVSASMLDLYDTKTKLLTYSIDMDGEEVTKYEWKNLPNSMKPSQVSKIGKTKKTSSKGKLISTSEISYKLSLIPQGYEFCTIEEEIELESKEKSITTDCDVFDSQKKIVGSNINIIIGNQYVLKGRGKVEIDRD